MAYDDSDVLYSDYEIDGVVVDSESGEPAGGVSLILLEAVLSGGDIQPGHKMDSLQVGADGKFSFYGRSYRGVSEYKFIKVSDSDSDSSSNYESEIFEVELTRISYPHEIAVTSQGCFGVSGLVLELEVDNDSDSDPDDDSETDDSETDDPETDDSETDDSETDDSENNPDNDSETYDD